MFLPYADLGLIIVDEEHRFGVRDKERIKALRADVDMLTLTATPIPRTLAMTLYGDLDVSVIDEMPPGRKPIKTISRNESSRLQVFGFIKKQIAEGRQVYIVYQIGRAHV